VLSIGLFTMGGATLRALAISRAEARARVAAELA